MQVKDLHLNCQHKSIISKMNQTSPQEKHSPPPSAVLSSTKTWSVFQWIVLVLRPKTPLLFLFRLRFSTSTQHEHNSNNVLATYNGAQAPDAMHPSTCSRSLIYNTGLQEAVTLFHAADFRIKRVWKPTALYLPSTRKTKLGSYRGHRRGFLQLKSQAVICTRGPRGSIVEKRALKCPPGSQNMC